MSRKRQGHSPADDDRRWEYGSLLIAIVLFFASFWATTYIAAEHKPEVMFSAAFALLSYICTVQYTRLSRFKRVDLALEDLRQAQDKITAYDKTKHDIINKLLSLLRVDRVLRQTGFHALEKALGGFDIENEEPFIKVSGKELTFISYEYFWQRILEVQQQHSSQKNIPKSKRIHMVARMTHSGRIEDWSKSELLLAIKGIHRNFIVSGGAVFRIFIDSGQTGKIEDYVRTMEEMLSVGVKCAYMHREFAPDIRAADFDADFCIVGPPKYSSDWTNADEHRVSSCEIGLRVTRYDQNRSHWDRLSAELQRYEYEPRPGLSETQAMFLAWCRDHFLGNVPELPRPTLVAAAKRCARVVADKAI